MARFAPLLVVAVLVIGGTGCGEDGDDRATTGTSEQTATSAGGGTSEPGSSDAHRRLCAAALQLNTVFDKVPPGDVPGMVAALGDVESALEVYRDNAPDHLKGAVEVLAEAMRDLATDLEAIEDDPDAASKAESILGRTRTKEVVAAEDATNAYEAETCGLD